MNYRTTRIYLRALELIDFVAGILKELPLGLGFAADELRRSSSSVLLNYIEGCGRRGKADRKRFFTNSIASAQETAGTLDVVRAFGAITPERCAKGQNICDHLVLMLERFK